MGNTSALANVMGSNVRISRTGENKTAAVTISNYSITANSNSGDYTVALELPFPPTDPDNPLQCACNADPTNPYRCMYTNRTPNSGNVNFFVKQGVASTAWFQILGGSSWASGSIQSKIPASTCSAPGCIAALIRTDPAGTVDSAGFPLTQTGSVVTSDTGGVYIHEASGRSNALQAEGLGVRVPVENYNYFFNKFGGRATNLANAIKPIAAEGLRVYRYNGNMVIDNNNPWNVAADEQVIVFVDGNLTIDDEPSGENRLTTVASGGTGFLMFIVRGNMTVTGDVGYDNTAVNPATPNVANVEGVFVANGLMTIASSNTALPGGGGGGSTLSTNLTAYWKLNEATGARVDSAGSHELEAQNTPTSAAGLIGNALSVASASSQRLRGQHTVYPTLDANGTGLNFTFSGWFKSTTSGVNQVLYGKRAAVNSGAGYSTHLNANGQLVCRVHNGTTEYSTNQNNESSSANGNWHHFACVVNRSDNTLKEYVDGVLNQSIPITGNFTSTNHFFLGSVGDHAVSFNGQLDEFAFWRGRALTAGEVAELYNGGNGFSYEAIVGGGGGGGAADRKFIGAGTFVGWGGVVLERNYDNGGNPALNNNAPTEVFIFRPDLLVNAPRDVKSAQMTWREIEPQF